MLRECGVTDAPRNSDTACGRLEVPGAEVRKAEDGTGLRQ